MSRKGTGTARPLTPGDRSRTDRLRAAYARRHPRAWAALRPVFETTLGAQLSSDGTTLPMIALDLAESHHRRGALARASALRQPRRKCGKTIIQNGFVLRIAGHPHLDSGVDLVKGKVRGQPDVTTVRARSTRVKMAAR